MKSLLTWVVVVAVVVAGGLLLARQSFNEAGNWADEDSSVIRWSIPIEHRSHDPQGMTWLHDIRLADCLFETLLKVELPSLNLGPGVAEKWSVSDDGMTYTYRLRKDAGWSNGDPVTAHDFVYSWRRILMPDSSGEYADLFHDIKGSREFFDRRQKVLAEYAKSDNKSREVALRLYRECWEDFDKNVGVKAVDDHTLVVTLDRPVTYFNELVAFTPFGPNHGKSIEQNLRVDVASGMVRPEPTYFNDPDKLVTNGAYFLQSYRFKVGSKLRPNPHYWNRANMGNAGVEERIIDTPAALLLYRNGELDWLPELPSIGSVASDLASSGRRDVHLEPWAGTYFYNFNCSDLLPSGQPNPLADPRVRQALSMAVDKQALVREVTRMNQPVARTFVPPGAVPGYTPPAQAGYGYDVARARALLAEAGYGENKKVEGLSIIYNTGGGHDIIAQAIKRMWEENLGVEVALEGMDIKQFGKRLRGREFSISRANWIGDYRDPTTFLNKHRSDGQSNDPGWKNSQYDQKLDEAAMIIDPALRFKTLEEAEAIFLHQAPIMPIYQAINMQVFNAQRVEDVHPNMWNFRRVELIRLKQAEGN